MYFKQLFLCSFYVFKGESLDFTLFFQTIFHILPRLAGLVEDEWIPIDKFAKFTDLPSGAGAHRYLSATQLRELRPGDWVQQDAGDGSVPLPPLPAQAVAAVTAGG